MNTNFNKNENRKYLRSYFDYFDQLENISDLTRQNKEGTNVNNQDCFRSSSQYLDEENNGNMVILNVYDLDNVSSNINKFTRMFELGAFHAGVEVYGIEYCFGSTSDGTTGITVNLPRRHPIHIYRESVKMGKTNFSRGEIKRIISDMKSLWPGSEYNIFRRNCLTFADEFCKILNVGPIPNYVKMLPELLCLAGDGLDKVTQHFVSIFDKVASTCSNLTSIESERNEVNANITDHQENDTIKSNIRVPFSELKLN